ncbi:MAG: hypothetical protein JWN04_3708, partial [Myxococcaceae bacterium]|nr:hypothetical protein [Myxococcaceae bacterium]
SERKDQGLEAAKQLAAAAMRIG